MMTSLLRLKPNALNATESRSLYEVVHRTKEAEGRPIQTVKRMSRVNAPTPFASE